MIDAEIIRRAKRGDREALNHVLERAWQFIREDQYCSDLSERVRDRFDFDDLSQDFVFRLKTRVSSWWEDNVQVWLRKWWKQHVFDAGRKRSLDAIPLDEPNEESNHSPSKARQDKVTDYRRMEDHLARVCDRVSLENSLDILSEGQRTVLKMRCWKNLKNHEIAEELGISESAVSSRIQRAKNNDGLKERLSILLDVRR